jgi:hypothetical protein
MRWKGAYHESFVLLTLRLQKSYSKIDGSIFYVIYWRVCVWILPENDLLASSGLFALPEVRMGCEEVGARG